MCALLGYKMTQTTININTETRDRIAKLKIHERQSYDEILNHICGCYETLEKEK